MPKADDEDAEKHSDPSSDEEEADEEVEVEQPEVCLNMKRLTESYLMIL